MPDQSFSHTLSPSHFQSFLHSAEEFLDGYVSLESLVSHSPEQRLSAEHALLILHQLVSVVRTALHKPIQICHRDIKPENVLVHTGRHHLVLLDFGLATHFSEREPRLTTCCGSPAFHSPELWRGLRQPPGTVKYWGPEVDVWCIGVTLLRCVTGERYPLGINHTSIDHLAEKVRDACLMVEDDIMRRTLMGLLDMDGGHRMRYFRDLHLPPIPNLPPPSEGAGPRDFKSTMFVPCEPRYTLALPLSEPSASHLAVRGHSMPPSPTEVQIATNELPTTSRLSPSRHGSTDSLRSAASRASSPGGGGASPHQLILRNPTAQPAPRVLSFIKYALRCAGVLYHAPDQAADPASALPTPLPTPPLPPDTTLAGSEGTIMPADLIKGVREGLAHGRPVFLHCVITLPDHDVEPETSKAANALRSALRPPLLRASTTAAVRATSLPPSARKDAKSAAAAESKKVRCLPFWLSISATHHPSTPSSPKTHRRTQSRRRHGTGTTSHSPPDTFVIQLSDARAMHPIREALSIARTDAPTRCDDDTRVERGRQRRDGHVTPPTIHDGDVAVEPLVRMESPALTTGGGGGGGLFSRARAALSRPHSSANLAATEVPSTEVPSSRTAPTTPGEEKEAGAFVAMF